MSFPDAIEHPNNVSALAAPRPAREHAIDYRISFSLLGEQIYFVVLAGGDQRSHSRLQRDGQLRSLALLVIKGLLMLTFATGLVVLLAGSTVIGLYLVKSFAGIDLFDGTSVLHAFLP